MHKSKSTKTLNTTKEFIPGDSGYNRVYPAPQYISKKLAIIILLIIIIGILFSLFTDISNVMN